jgi:MFS family permease
MAVAAGGGVTSQTGTSDSGSISLRYPARAALLLAGILSAYAQSGLGSVLPAIEAHFSDVPQAGFITRLLVSIIGTMIMLGSPFVGALADRIGRRRVLLAGLLIYGVFGCAGFFLDNLYLLLGSRVMVGLGVAAVGAVMLAIVVTHTEGAARNRWLGYVNTVGSLCTFVLVPLAGFAGHYGWQWPFLIHGIAFPLFFLALFGLAPDAPAAPAKADAVMDKSSFAVLWRPLLLTLAGGILMTGQMLYAPFHMRDIGVGDPRFISGGLFVVLLGTVSTGFMYGAIRTKLSMDAAFAVGFGLGAAGLVICGFSTTYVQMIIGLMLAGLGCGVVSPNFYAMAAAVATEANRARVMGLTKGALFTGPLVGQLVLEPVMKASNAGTALLTLALFALGLTLIKAWHWLRPGISKPGYSS